MAEAQRLAGQDASSIDEALQPITVAEQFLDDCRVHGDPTATRAASKAIMQWATQHHELMEDSCNGVEVFDREGEPLPELKRCRENIQANAAALGAKGVVFSGDPRGATVKLVFPDGHTNDWGKEGYCVPIDSSEE